MKLSMFLKSCLLLSIILGSQAHSKDFSFAGIKKLLKKENLGPEHSKKVQTLLLQLDNKSVPTIIEVMKSDTYPDKNRWVATLTLARIMGEKSLPFIKKFLRHPNWMMRLSALKVMRMFKDKTSDSLVEKMLFDKSLLVRVEALEMIKSLKKKNSAKSVWKMMYDKKNYQKFSKSKVVPTEVISRILKTIETLDYKKAKPVLVKLKKERRFSSLSSEIQTTINSL